MNWPRAILDGIMAAVLFNAVVGLGFLLVPQAYSTMFPREIRDAAAKYVRKKDVRLMRLILYPMYLVMCIYWGVSAGLNGVTGFWPLFWTGYVEMFIVNVSDFLILDCWLPPKAKPLIRGAEHCRAWERRQWLMKLAVPEHALGWPLVFCPLAGAIVAGVGALLSKI